MGTPAPFSILSVNGPYREPREPALSYDYSVQRPHWPTPHGIRVKVWIADEMDYFKTTVLGIVGGSPGQQVKLNQVLSRYLADAKLHIANEEGLFAERLDVMIGPFTGPLAHLFPHLQAWMQANKDAVRHDVREKIKL